jgi:hypothetical protein
MCVLQVVAHEKDLREAIIKISNYLKKDYNFFIIDYNRCVARALLLVGKRFKDLDVSSTRQLMHPRDQRITFNAKNQKDPEKKEKKSLDQRRK